MSDGELALGEPHPAAQLALDWISKKAAEDPKCLPLWLEAMYSTALGGNRTAEVCVETLRRLVAREPVSDRYILGLAWILRAGENAVAATLAEADVPAHYSLQKGVPKK